MIASTRPRPMAIGFSSRISPAPLITRGGSLTDSRLRTIGQAEILSKNTKTATSF